MDVTAQVMTGFLAAGYLPGGDQKAGTTTAPSLGQE
jgi:hypothetical protein